MRKSWLLVLPVAIGLVLGGSAMVASADITHPRSNCCCVPMQLQDPDGSTHPGCSPDCHLQGACKDAGIPIVVAKVYTAAYCKAEAPGLSCARSYIPSANLPEFKCVVDQSDCGTIGDPPQQQYKCKWEPNGTFVVAQNLIQCAQGSQACPSGATGSCP